MGKRTKKRANDTSVAAIGKALGRRVVRLGTSGINVIDLPPGESILWRKVPVREKGGA